MNKYEKFKNLIVDEIERAYSEIQKKYELENIHGFALGTDDDVMTLFHVLCTSNWLEKEEARLNDEDIGYIFVEWQESAGENLFLDISKMFRKESERDYKTNEDWAIARDKRLLSISFALEEVRKRKLFKEQTFLCFGSTDPSTYIEKLEWVEIQRYNVESNVKRYAKAMGY
jgi:hypothetical protein